MAFTSKSNHHSTASSHFNLQAPQTLSPIEQLQEQQRQFQEQLILLQHQQRQLQATAALVAAASTSPYTGGSGSGSGPMRPVSTPGVYGSHSAGSVGTTPPGCFSPLTSPALDASARATHYNRQHGNSPAFASHHQYTPHPLSAISSPALNPVGSSGGAQQTLSPALQPQNNAEVADPEYIRALVGFLDGQQTHIGGQFQHVYQSPITSSAQQLSSPLAGAEGSTGPHRNSLPVKSRPSPMMKPTNHRAHARHSSSSTLPDQFSVPSSPIAQKYYPSVPGMGYLPPAAFDQRSVQQQQQAMHSSASNSSTPSPVDLSQMMPPPPIPPYNSVSKSMTPLTPASLMNLGHTSGNGDTNKRQLAALPKRQVATRKAVAAAASVPAAKKAGNGTKIVPSSIGKRALAIRPPGNIGVRTGRFWSR